jgi:enterochelin esterase family protein
MSFSRFLIFAALPLLAQPPVPPPQFVSPEVSADRTITFRLHAPQAASVRLSGGDIPGNQKGAEMTKGENGVWSVKLGPVEPGAYRYNFNIAGVATIDPRNPAISESNNNVWSLVVVPGSPLFDTRDVPHGAVAAVTYHSKALGRPRRMHVYTPPGYESGKGKYPVFYLLHGAGDCDEAWSSVGRAGFILDNLIADKKAKPMIVVMPAGHTAPGGYRPPLNGDDFSKDFASDILPYVEANYRVLPGRANRAIAGLSMGGAQTLNIAFTHLDKFAHIGVFSSGILSLFRPAVPGVPATPAGPTWEEQNAKALDDAALKKGLKTFWIGIGKDDFLLEPSRKSVELFKKHGFSPVYEETGGAHTWLVWRDYLSKFAPMLF